MKTRLNSEFRRGRAFTLLEVMIALAIFFMCVFAILGVVSRGLSQARALQTSQVDAASALAELSLTNRLTEGPLPMEIVSSFEQMHPGYSISGEIYEVATNGLFQIDFTVGGITAGNRSVSSKSSVLLWRPLSQSTRFNFRRR